LVIQQAVVVVVVLIVVTRERVYLGPLWGHKSNNKSKANIQYSKSSATPVDAVLWINKDTKTQIF